MEFDFKLFTNRALLEEVDQRIDGCAESYCSVCPRTIAAVKDLARRLGVEDFKPRLECLRELRQQQEDRYGQD
jgi:hypothetical protein